MPRPLRVLLVEDRPNDAELVLLELRRSGYVPEWLRVETEDTFVAQLEQAWDIILSDYAMPEFSGTRALQLLQERGRDIPFILISGTIGEETAVAAMKQRAADYLLKDRLGRLGLAVEHALEKARLERERRLAHETLRLREQALAQISQGVLICDEQRRVLYANGSFQGVTGYAEEEMLGRTCAILQGPETDPRTIAAIRAALEERRPFDGEILNYRKDGTKFWNELSIVPISSPYGGARFLGIQRDVTARKQTEDALRESDRRFRDMLENVALIAITLDLQGRVTFCNDHLLQLTGWTREQVLGCDWFARFLSRLPEIRERFLAHLDSQAIWPHYENPIETRDGRLRDIVWNNTMLRDEHGNVVGVASLGEDVTDRKQALERVREQAAMLEHAREAIIVRELPGGRIKFWNHGAERMYGWSGAEAAGGDMGALLLGDPSATTAMDEDLLRSGEWRGEQKHATKSGGTLTVSSHATLIRDDLGRPNAVLVINIDVTEQRNLEARFLRAQRMESIGTLASGIAHDLNNILAPITMSAPLLRMDLDPSQRERIVSAIEVSAQRGAEIVRQVLAFGRGLEGTHGPLRIDTAISEVLRILQETFPKSITLEGRIDRPLHGVLGDATQLHQVLLNLCVNARDAMPEGGRLLLSARSVELEAESAARLPGLQAGPHVLIEVSDTGTGIAPEVAEHMFEPFFTTKGVGSGTGLGLSTVLGIVRSHGGAIQVESKPGGGTTFQIHLPAAEGPRPASARAAVLEFPRARGETVLVVDDEPAVQTAARLILENAGYRVLAAGNGAEALATYTQNPQVALILTDLMMPVLDGLNLIRNVRRLDPNLPIIASTGLGEKKQTEVLSALGVRWTLLKPYDAAQLVETMSEALPPAAKAEG